MTLHLPRLPHGTRSWERLSPHLLAALVLALCLGMTSWVWRGARAAADQELRAEFDFRGRELVAALAQRMASYGAVLDGVQGLFASSVRVERAEFASYVDSLELASQFPGLQGIGYMALVPDAALAAFQARVRATDLPGFNVHPAGARPDHAPVLYLHPDEPANRRALGFDATSEPVRRAVLERARDSGQAAISEKLTLVQDAQAQPPLPPRSGFLMVLPVYRNGAAHATLEQRRAALVGWVYAPFRLSDLLAGLGGERSPDLDVTVYDGDLVSAASRMDDGQALAAPPRLHAAHSLAVGGRRWTVVVGAKPAFEARLRRDEPQQILAAGTTAGALLALLTWLLARSRLAARAALATAEQLARELADGQQHLRTLAESAQRAQAMSRSILDSTLDGVLVDNGARRLLTSNQRFRELWSLPAAVALDGDEHPMLEHLEAQLLYPAPFLYSRSLQFNEGEEHRDLLRLKDGRFFEQIGRAVRLGSESARLWSFRDVTERKQIEQRERSHRHVLELLARGAPLTSILEAIVLGVEATNPGMLCSVMLVDEGGRRLMAGAAPSMPDYFLEAIDGIALEHGSCCCASAALDGARVVVSDLSAGGGDATLRALARRAGIAACWSEPIRGASGKVLGTFAIYHSEPHLPSPANVVLIEQASYLAGIAIEQGRAAQAVRAGEERFRSLYDNAPVALWEQDWSAVRRALAQLEEDGVGDLGAHLRAHPLLCAQLAAQVRIVDLNSAALAQVGADAKGQASLGLAQLFDAHALGQFAEAVAALAGGAQLFACESSFERLDGVQRHNEVTLLVMPGHGYALDFLIASTIDITERKRMDAELLMLATTDFLTGLPNRREFMARLDDELARLQRGMDECAAVLMIDIDHFKHVNDRYGHARGDAVLRHLAALMRASARKVDTLGRVGGEEFAILLPGADHGAALAYAERLREAVAASALADGGAALAVTISIGIASLRVADPSADAALIRADKALYRAKEAGRNRVDAGAG